MSARTVVPETVAWIAMLGVIAACSGSVAPPATEIPLPKPDGSPAMARMDSTALHLVVGDTLRLNQLRALDAPPLRYRSSDPTVMQVASGSQLVAVRPGSAILAASTVATPAKDDSVRVIVMTPQRARVAMVSLVCPNRDESVLADTALDLGDLPLIHEYHDCQRLIEGTTYGPLVGIFAHRNVDRYQHWNQYTDGRLAAVIVNFAKGSSLTSYPALGIAPGTNCLVIRAKAEDDWEAAIVNQPQPLAKDPAFRHYGTCRDGMTWGAVPTAAIGKLRVRVQKGVDLRGRAIAPPVARWDWDEGHRLNYLGVKCDSITWCEIGAIDFVPSAPVMNAAGQPIAKGYYDEQYLADTTGTRVTSVFATIIPSSDATDTAGMVPMAGPVPKFHLSHLRINETGPRASSDYRYYKDRFAALSVSPKAPYARADTSDLKIIPIGTFPTGGMYGVYDGEVNLRPLSPDAVAFRSHPSSVVKVPTVRWRWQSNDEGAWGYCRPYGCCETLGKK